MGEFQSAGKTVRYTDEDVIQLAADLYQVVDKDYNGSPSVDSTRLERILQILYSGAPLGVDEWNALTDIQRRYATQLQTFRDRGREGQNAALPSGPGRISEALSILPASVRASLREGYKSSTGSGAKRDMEVTPSHLLDTVVSDLAHASRHLDRMKDTRADKGAHQFNYEHSRKHLDGAIDHAQRLGEHLEKAPTNPKVFAEERAAIRDVRGVKEGSPYPPPGLGPAQDGRKVPGSEAPQSCGNCGMFWMGRCGGYWNLSVEPDWWCRSWYLDKDWADGESEPVASVLWESDIWKQAVWELDRMRESEDLTVSGGGGPKLRLTQNELVAAPHRPTICVDFDGVIHAGPHGMPGLVEGDLVKGAKQGLKHLAQNYKVVILTARRDLNAVRVWCVKVGVDKYIEEITNIKPSARAYIDDRAIHFSAWPLALEQADPEMAVLPSSTVKPVVKMLPKK